MQYFAFQWHITDTCDQRCQHCYIFSENYHTDLKEPSPRDALGIWNVDKHTVKADSDADFLLMEVPMK